MTEFGSQSVFPTLTKLINLQKKWYEGQYLHATQCGNFIIFPSLRFYVKSILRILEMENLPIANLGGYEFCSFGKFRPSKSAKNHKNQNSEPLNVVKWLILDFKNPKNWFHVKSEWLKNPDISTLWEKRMMILWFDHECSKVRAAAAVSFSIHQCQVFDAYFGRFLTSHLSLQSMA